MARSRYTSDAERPLVGRVTELAAVDAVLAAAAGGEGQALLVEGPAGIGKTSLLSEARGRAARAGMTVLAARGTELERDLPLGLVRQALAPAARDAAARERLLQGAAALAAPALLDAADPSETPAAGLLHGLYWMVANLSADRPVALVADDVHWADEASRAFLAYLARRADSLPLALVLGTRPAAGQAALDELARDPDVRHLELTALDASEVEELLRERREHVTTEFAVACRRATGGNPFLLGELVRELDSASVRFDSAGLDRVTEVTPPSVARAVATDLGRLSPEAARLVQAVSVLGDGTDLELAAELAGVPVGDAGEAAARAVRAGLLDDATELRFRHPLLAGAVASAQTAQERALAHARAAELLRERGAAPERVAAQLRHSPPSGDPRTVEDLRRAAASARARGAPATAAAFLERAVAEPPRADLRASVLLELAETHLGTGATSEASDRLEEAHRCATDPLVRARALPLMAQANPTTSALRDRVCDLIEESLPEVEPLDRELALRLRSILALDERRTEPGDVEGETVGEAVFLAHLVFARTRPGASADEVADLARRAAKQAVPMTEEGAATLGFTGVVLGLRWTDQLDDAIRLLDRAVDSGRRRGAVIDYGAAMSLRAAVHRQAGRLREAEADARGALDAQLPVRWAFARGAGPLVGSLLDQGRVDEAAAGLEAAGLAGEFPDAPPLLPILLTRMAVRAARREYESAKRDWQEALRRADRFRGPNAAWVEDIAVAADVHRALGEHEAARELVDRGLALARDWGRPGVMGVALRARARLDGAPAAETLREAARLLGESPRRLEHAKALVDLGAALRRRGDRAASREPLREGYDLATQCHAQGLAEVAREELRASGVTLRREALSGVDSLTPSELRIAQMATELTNAQIAQELFLTVKTVEMHLTHAYRKLGVRGRPQLARALGSKAQGADTGSAT